MLTLTTVDSNRSTIKTDDSASRSVGRNLHTTLDLNNKDTESP